MVLIRPWFFLEERQTFYKVTDKISQTFSQVLHFSALRKLDPQLFLSSLYQLSQSVLDIGLRTTAPSSSLQGTCSRWSARSFTLPDFPFHFFCFSPCSNIHTSLQLVTLPVTLLNISCFFSRFKNDSKEPHMLQNPSAVPRFTSVPPWQPAFSSVLDFAFRKTLCFCILS